MVERTILCVDDEINVLNALKRLLRKEEYRLLTATSGPEALEILDRESVQLVVSDQRMPEMSGTELLQQVKVQSPHSIRVILSGYAELAAILDAINKGEIYRFLTKPWNDEELRITIRQCLDQYALQEEHRRLTEQTREQNEALQRLNQDLDSLVEARTRSLILSQDILEVMPMPVVGISTEGLGMLTNEAVNTQFPSLSGCVVGNRCEAFLPAPVVDRVQACLQGSTDTTDLTENLDGQTVRFHIKPLNSASRLRGCVLILSGPEPIQNYE